jgi:Branched-chain amino acid ABC-type transport system, permease components
MLELITFSIINGVLYGMLLFMLSSGLTLIFSMMGVLNFAHASFYMLGAYFAYQISTFIGFWPALFLAPLGVAVLGALVERYGLRHVHKHGHVAELLFTFGLVYVIEELVHMIWGRMPVDYRIPDALNFTLFTLFNTSFPAYRGFMLLVALVMFASIYLILRKTRIGMIVQASLSYPEMVGALGHNVPRVFMGVFAFGTGLAGLAGVIAGNYFITEPGMAWAMGPIVFVVVVFGGLGSLPGALIGSLIIGIVQTVSVAMPYSLADALRAFGVELTREAALADLWFLELSRVAPILPYLLLVLMLIFRPRGLMGTRES